MDLLLGNVVKFHPNFRVFGLKVSKERWKKKSALVSRCSHGKTASSKFLEISCASFYP
jgi:hypothetical protein